MSAAKTEPDGYAQRVNSGDWESITDEVNAFGGGALLPQLLTAVEAAEIRDLDHVDAAFRQTVTMGPLRFGEGGQYKYFHAPYPEPIERLKQALYPRLLPIARDWWGGKLGREAIWPDTLDEWLELCHRAGGQNKSTAILLKYGAGDWNALHRDLYGDLVFPLQVVLNLNQPGVDHTGGGVSAGRTASPGAVAGGSAFLLPQGHGFVFATRDRPVRSKRGWSAAPVRHGGVSPIRSGGERITLALVFHDAA